MRTASFFRFPYPRRLRASLLGLALMAACAGAFAQTSVNEYGVEHQGNVIGDDVLYSIGGGRHERRSEHAFHRRRGRLEQQPDLRGHVLSTTIQHQLDGITNGFQTIMSSVIQTPPPRSRRCRR